MNMNMIMGGSMIDTGLRVKVLNAMEIVGWIVYE